MKSVLRLAVFTVVVASILFQVNQAWAQSGTEMDLSASYQFGDHITFVAQNRSSIQILNATLLISDATQVHTYSMPVTFDQNGVSEFRFDTKQNSLRPFTTIQWRYDLTLADGSAAQSQTASMRYNDDRFAWQTLESDALRIHWYDGGEQFGASALNAAQAGLQNIRNFFEADLSQPVDVYIYANENDLRGTVYASDAWVAGHADSPAGVAMVMIEPGPDQNILLEQRIPHELMHVMLYRQIGAGYKNIPAWFREGMSMLAEVYPNPDYDNYLKDADTRNALIPMLDLCDSFSPYSDSAFLAYAESRSFTNYLHGLYGSDGLLDLADTFADGVDCEHGTERTFGVPLAKLERDWRKTLSGETNIISDIGRFVPYMVLLCLVIFVPMLGILNSMRKKGN